MTKRLKIIVSIVVGLGLLLAIPFLNMPYLWGYQKIVDVLYVTNPDAPNFKIEEFSFKKYTNHQDLSRALKAMFPSGTSKGKINKILVDQAGAKLTDRTSIGVYTHTYPGMIPFYADYGCQGNWNVKMFFDQDQNGQYTILKEIQVMPNC